MPSLRFLAASASAVILTLLSQKTYAQDYPNCPDPSWVCTSLAVDFQQDGVYFQNENSTADFTFSSQYDECQAVIGYNVLVDPNNNEYICTNTTLSPDNTTQTSTCPIEKAQLISGDYSVLIYSNNGDCAPMAFKREFVLTVGPQVTTTLTPSVTMVSTSYPVSVITTTSTNIVDVTLAPSTTTTTVSKKTPTTTVTPKTTTTTTTTLSTKTLTRYNLLAIPTVVTTTAKCHTSSVVADLTISTTATAIASSSAVPNRMMIREPFNVLDEVLYDKEAFMQKRAERLNNAVRKRDVDQPTVYVVLTAASDIAIVTSTVFAATVDFTTTSVVQSTSTVTPPVVTLYLNTITTVTAPTVTSTKTRTIKMVTTWVTATKFSTVKITTTVTPSAKAAACSATGGYMQ